MRHASVLHHHCSEPLKRPFLVYSVGDRGEGEEEEEEEEEEEGGAGGTRETRDISDGPSVSHATTRSNLTQLPASEGVLRISGTCRVVK